MGRGRRVFVSDDLESGLLGRYVDYEPTTKRVCLRCKKKFDSTGKFNKICDACKAINKTMSPMAGWQHPKRRAL